MRVVQLFGAGEKWMAHRTGSFTSSDEPGPHLIIVRSGSVELRNPDGERHILTPLMAIIVQRGEQAEFAALEDTSLSTVELPADCVLE